MRSGRRTPLSGWTRRRFLKSVGAGAVAAGSLQGRTAAAPQAGASSASLRGPGSVPIELTVNGTAHALKLPPRVTLLEAVREQLGLTGAKKACDHGGCGACSVLLDGKAVYACSVLAIEAEGRPVETVESLEKGGRLSALQTSFLDHDGLQCGFCTPGMLVACESFLRRPKWRFRAPHREEAVLGLSGNLCRCGAYGGVTEALLKTSRGERR